MLEKLTAELVVLKIIGRLCINELHTSCQRLLICAIYKLIAEVIKLRKGIITMYIFKFIIYNLNVYMKVN